MTVAAGQGRLLKMPLEKRRKSRAAPRPGGRIRGRETATATPCGAKPAPSGQAPLMTTPQSAPSQCGRRLNFSQKTNPGRSFSGAEITTNKFLDTPPLIVSFDNLLVACRKQIRAKKRDVYRQNRLENGTKRFFSKVNTDRSIKEPAAGVWQGFSTTSAVRTWGLKNPKVFQGQSGNVSGILGNGVQLLERPFRQWEVRTFLRNHQHYININQ